MALILRGRGIERVRPLAGGFYAWRDRGFPVISVPERMRDAGREASAPIRT